MISYWHNILVTTLDIKDCQSERHDVDFWTLQVCCTLEVMEAVITCRRFDPSAHILKTRWADVSLSFSKDLYTDNN